MSWVSIDDKSRRLIIAAAGRTPANHIAVHRETVGCLAHGVKRDTLAPIRLKSIATGGKVWSSTVDLTAW